MCIDLLGNAPLTDDTNRATNEKSSTIDENWKNILINFLDLNL